MQLALLDVQSAVQADIQRPFELVVLEKQPKRSRNPLKLAGAIGATVRAHPGRLSGLSVFHSKSDFYGAFVWARRTLNRPKRRVPARAGLET